jgi:hypothetical protein
MLSYVYPVLGVFWTMLMFFAFAAWIFLVIWVFIDNFRRSDHSGWAKALWTIAIFFLPVFGVLIYLIARPSDIQLA